MRNIVDKIKQLESVIEFNKKQINNILIKSMCCDTYTLADKMIKEIYDNQKRYVKLQNMIDELYKIEGLTGKVLQLKYENYDLTNEKIAEMLGMSQRTLYRQLKQEGEIYEYKY